jgi:hypothetical protein
MAWGELLIRLVPAVEQRLRAQSNPEDAPLFNHSTITDLAASRAQTLLRGGGAGADERGDFRRGFFFKIPEQNRVPLGIVQFPESGVEMRRERFWRPDAAPSCAASSKAPDAG